MGKKNLIHRMKRKRLKWRRTQAHEANRYWWWLMLSMGKKINRPCVSGMLADEDGYAVGRR